MKRLIAVALALAPLAAFAGAPCPPMTPLNVFITFNGATSNCTILSGNCITGEQIAFTVATFGYDFACTTHTFAWSFGDAATGTGRNVMHTFAGPGTYNVQVTITNPQQTFTLSQPVTVVAAPPPAPALTPGTLALLALAVAGIGAVRLLRG